MSKSGDTRLRLTAEQVSQLCKAMPLSAGTALLVAALAVLINWPYADHPLTLCWSLALLVVSALRLTLYRRYTRARSGDQAALVRLMPAVRSYCLMAGLCWAGSIPLFYRPADLVHQLFLVFVLAGVTVGSTTSMVADKRTALSFQLPILVPLVLRLAADGDPLHLSMAGMVLFYGVFLLMSVQSLSRDFAQNIELRLQALQREQQLYESEMRYRQLAHHDSLTGLPNRFSLQGLLPPILVAAAGSGTRVALLYIDLDGFKDVNDSRGHGCGDQVLVAVARRLRACLRPGDLVVRMGGDEFIVVAACEGSCDDAGALATRIRDTLAAPLLVEGELVNAGASIGIGIYPEDGTDTEALMKHADIALYQAKAGGRAKFQFYNPDMSVAVTERLYFERALAQALDEGQIHVEYQPIVSLPVGTITGLEALARWRHPQRGLIPPSTFIPIAEQCGLIVPLSELVMRQVGTQIRAWMDERLPVVPVAINVSPRQFESGSLDALVVAVCAECGIEPSQLQIEITESMVMSGVAGEFGALEALRKRGTRVSIDDFGTGYSSLSYLKHLPIDCVKIDRSFVRDMQNDERDSVIVAAIVNIGHSLGLRVIAEGVETVHQAEQLSGLGCDAAQGYYFHRPLSAQACSDLLRQLGQQRPLSDTMRLRIQHWMHRSQERRA